MTIRDTLCTLGLTQTEFAALIGVSVRAVNKWCTGAAPTPAPIERILMLMERVTGVVEEMRAMKGVPP